ncbi:MAG: Fic family protein [Desulfobacteraceae bacterium]|nr:Fic family protein [Desulfobacteraceae bacterium]
MKESIFQTRACLFPWGIFPQKIHKHLFEDTYEWAGEFRNFPTARESSVFCRPEYIKQETDKITSNINITNLKKMKKKEFVKKLAHTIAELNAVHPFLDGNGRILRIYAQQLSKAAEYKLNILKIRKEAWNQAAINSFNGDNKNLERIISNNLYRSKDLGIGR